jgi:hypothetical protein
MMRTARAAALAALALAVSALTPVAAQRAADVFQGEAIEAFLSRGSVREVRDLGTGITRPQQVTLEFEGERHDALYKTIDVSKQGATTLEDGTVEVGFQDTWQTEVAAYQLDRMIGLGLTPATVERRIGRDVGSLQWWVDSMMSEGERVAQGVTAPDVEAWNQLMFKVRLFDQLIANTDRHPGNMLVTSDFQVRLIDHSRSFRENRELAQPGQLTRFSRTLLDAIAALDEDGVKDRLGRYLSSSQIQRLLQRRDAILALAQARVAEHGEAAVIYP